MLVHDLLKKCFSQIKRPGTISKIDLEETEKTIGEKSQAILLVANKESKGKSETWERHLGARKKG